MIITIDTSSLTKSLEKAIEDIQQGVEEGMRQVASEMAQMQHDIIDANVGGNRSYVRTGLLKSGVTIMPLEWSPSGVSMTITNTTSYAIYNELGTGIYAENGQGRQGGWYYPTGDGSYRFTLGLPPKYFVRDSYEFYKDKAPIIIQQSIFNKL
ncbi:MAG: tail completion or Neck1 protein [Malazfec virus 1]